MQRGWNRKKVPSFSLLLAYVQDCTTSAEEGWEKLFPTKYSRQWLTERPFSSLVLGNAHHCILIPFPKDRRDVSTRELGEQAVPTPTIREEEHEEVRLSS